MRNLPLIGASALALGALLVSGCTNGRVEERMGEPGAAVPLATDTGTAQRLEMVRDQIERRGIRDPAVLRAMREVPREAFVPPAQRHLAYADHPLPIGFGQTISQPYIVGYMTEAAQLTADSRVLEIGTGSGYQAAVLAEIADEVYSIEIVPELAARAEATLDSLGYDNVQVRAGNGYLGWPEAAPFDGIVVTAAPPRIPDALVQQLAPGARMVVPVGTAFQQMTIVERTPAGIVESTTLPVRFVPMVQEPPPGDTDDR